MRARLTNAGGRYSLLKGHNPPVPSPLALDEALWQFETLYPRAGQVVELRFFAGKTETETAELLDISLTTLKRDWEFAKVWLYRQLTSAP